jgi:hypothetical protein
LTGELSFHAEMAGDFMREPFGCAFFAQAITEAQLAVVT